MQAPPGPIVRVTRPLRGVVGFMVSGFKGMALALTLASLPGQAQDSGAILSPVPARPTLVFLSAPQGSGNQNQQEDKRFGTTLLHDLKHSGAFHLLDPKAVPGSSNGSSARIWRGAGADLLLRFASATVAQGKLLVKSECINLETGAVVLKRTFLGKTAAVNRMAHRLADFLVGKVTGTPGVADSSIVFARATSPGIKEIFSVDRDGGALRQLTAFGSLTTHPAVSADGRLAMVTYKGGPPQIWGQRQPRGPFLLMYPKAGTPGMEISDLAWAPDGDRICFTQGNRKGRSDIYLLDLQTHGTVRLTQDNHTSWAPSWNPAGTDIAYLSDREGTPQVYLMASDGSQVRRLTGDPAPKACVAWDAQGDRIGYVASSGGSFDLFTLTPTGSTRQKITSSAEPIESLCWAPDGRWLLLGLSNRNGSRLRIAGLDGKVKDLADGIAGCEFPQWTQNPAPIASSLAADRSAPLPGLALVGAAPLQ